MKHSLKETVLGIDVGRHAVRVLGLRQKAAAAIVERAEVLRLPPEGTDARSIVLPWLQQLGISGCPCVLSVPGVQCLFQPLALPRNDPRTMEQAVAVEMVRFHELSGETMTVGFVPFELGDGQRRVLIAMSRQTIIDEALALAEAVRLQVVDIVPGPVALFNALVHLTPRWDAPVLCLDMGHESTALAIGSSAGLVFARGFSGGGRLLTEALATRQGLPAGQAENEKWRLKAFPEELVPSAEVWLAEVQSCLSLYGTLLPEASWRPRRILLAGGGARLAGFSDWVSQRLGLPVGPAPSPPGLPASAATEDWTVAYGAALSGLERAAVTLSLLPSNLRDDLHFRRQKPYWIGAAVLAALVFGVSLIGGARDIRRKSARLAEQRRSLHRRQQLVEQIERVKSFNDRLREQTVPLREMLRRGPVLRDLLTLVAEAKAPSDALFMICDAGSYFSAGNPAGGSPSGRTRPDRRERTVPPALALPPSLDRLILEGVTGRRSLSSVKELISRLREAPYVASADLLSDDQVVSLAETRPPAREGGLRFVIDVRLAPP